MSRIGKKPIPVPTSVTVSIEPDLVRVNGPKGELTERIPRDITVAQEGEELVVKRPTDRGEHRALHGLTRSLVANMVEGVTTGFSKSLEIQGVGYRAALKGKDLELQLGYSHPVPIKAPEGIEFEVPQPTRVIVKGNSKQQVGEIVRITLKYTDDRRPAISGLRRVSRPGQRRYAASDGIPKVQGGMGTTIVSTSRGVMTGHEARQAGVGGEVVAEIW